jgi:Protein of unknown function (DUF2510)
MTIQLPPAGWYPDPSGKPGQMYWDGQRWQTAIPATTPPAAAPTPWDKVRPHVDMARPHWDKGRRFWSGLSRQRKVILALAGLLVVLAVIAVPVVAFDYLFGAPDTSSTSYQAGYKDGTSGTAHNLIALGSVHADDFKGACDASFSAAPISSLDQNDYMRGCLDALRG